MDAATQRSDLACDAPAAFMQRLVIWRPSKIGEPYYFQRWFTFEGRCFLCGRMIGGTMPFVHLNVHCREGYLKRSEDHYTQLKAHPTGFGRSPYDKPDNDKAQ